MLDDRTTESSITFQNPDGTLTTELDSGPVRFEDAGEWVDIDTTLVKQDGAWVPKAAPLDISFPDGTDVAGQAFVDLKRDGGDAVMLGWPTKLPEPTVDGSTLTYPDAVPGGDLVVTALADGFTHSVVLNQRPESGERVQIPIPVDLQGTKVAEAANGNLKISSPEDQALKAPAPVMWDSATTAEDGDLPERVEPVATTVTQNGTGAADATITLTPDEHFLNDPDTVYPVTIDPTFTEPSPSGDTFIQNTGSYTSGSTVQGWGTLRVGTQDSGTHYARTFVRFSQIDLADKDLVSAQLQARVVKSLSCTNGSTVAERITGTWDFPSLTWPGPAADSSSLPQYWLPHGGPTGSACAAHGWATWNVLPHVTAWKQGQPQRGFRLRAATETTNGSYREYRSVNATPDDTTYHPKLVITYSLPQEPSSGDDGDPVDRPEPAAASATGYGVDSDALTDLTAVAENEGISVQQAVDAYGWQPEFAQVVGTLAERYPNSFASAAIESGATPGGTIAFTDQIPEEAAGLVDDLLVPVTLSAGAPYSAEELVDIAAAARDGIVAQAGDDASVLVEPVSATGSLSATVSFSGSEAAAGTTSSSMRSAARAEIQQQRPTVALPNVTVTVVDDTEADAVAPTTLRGGVKIGNHKAKGYYVYCTSGFPAKEDGKSSYGVLTAAHCYDDLPTYSYDTSTERQGLSTASLVLSKKRGDIQYHRSTGESVGRGFYYEVGKMRAIQGVMKAQILGPVCVFGRTSNGFLPNSKKKTCGTVREAGLAAHYPANELDPSMDVDGLTSIDGTIAQNGDSGGPVFFGGNAVGIISGIGRCYAGTKCTLFSPLWGVEGYGTFDVHVNH